MKSHDIFYQNKEYSFFTNSTQVLKTVARSKPSLDITARCVVIHRQSRHTIPAEQATGIQKAATLKAFRRAQMSSGV